MTIYPAWSSWKRPTAWLAFICLLLSTGSLLCVSTSPRGIDFAALKIFAGIPFALWSFFLILFLSYKIKITEEKIVFYMFFLPVKGILLKEIRNVCFHKVAPNGQRCALMVTYTKNRSYIYPVRLFDEKKIQELIKKLNS